MAIENTYRVVFRSGGDKQCKWTLVNTVFSNETNARAAAILIEHMGYKALVKNQREIDFIGLPIGWEPDLVDNETDSIVVTPQFTEWTCAELAQRAA